MSTVLPENVLKAMSPEARRSLGKAGKTLAEVTEKWAYGQERKLQQQIKQLLDIKGLIYTWSRTDKRATVEKGHPDFVIYLPNRCELMVEVKVGDGKLSQGQIGWHARYQECTGRIVHVVRSLGEVQNLLK